MHRDFFDAALEGSNGGSKVTHARIVSRTAGRRQLLRWRLEVIRIQWRIDKIVVNMVIKLT